MSVGKRIKEARGIQGITQKDLSVRASVKQQMISKLEAESATKTTDIVNLALALNVNPVWLANGTGSMIDGEQSPSQVNEPLGQYNALNDKQRALLKLYDALPTEQQDALLVLLDGSAWMQEKRQFTEPPHPRRKASKKSKDPAKAPKQMRG